MGKIPIQKGKIEIPITSKMKDRPEKIRDTIAEDRLRKSGQTLSLVTPKK